MENTCNRHAREYSRLIHNESITVKYNTILLIILTIVHTVTTTCKPFSHSKIFTNWIYSEWIGNSYIYVIH